MFTLPGKSELIKAQTQFLSPRLVPRLPSSLSYYGIQCEQTATGQQITETPFRPQFMSCFQQKYWVILVTVRTLSCHLCDAKKQYFNKTY